LKQKLQKNTKKVRKRCRNNFKRGVPWGKFFYIANIGGGLRDEMNKSTVCVPGEKGCRLRETRFKAVTVKYASANKYFM